MSAFIQFCGVSLTFDDGDRPLTVLEQASFSFPAVGLVSILGKSGSGKTSILNLIAGLIRPTKGKIIVDTFDLSSLRSKHMADYRSNNVAYVFQNHNLIEDMSALENIRLYLLIKNIPFDLEKIQATFQRFKMADKLMQAVQTLSGGEKQRLSLIAALLSESRIVLLDEPTGALDQQNGALVMQDIKAISEERLVIMVSHNKELVQEYSTHIFHLKGRTLRTVLSKESQTKLKNRLRHRPKKLSLLGKIIKRYFKKNLRFNLLSLLSSVFAFTAFFLSGYLLGASNNIVHESLVNRPDYMHVKVCEQETRSINGSLINLTRAVRPSSEKIYAIFDSINSFHLELDFSYVFPTIYSIDLPNHPSESIWLKSFYGSAADDFSAIFINQKAQELLGLTVGDSINVRHSFAINIYENGRTIPENYVFNHDFIIMGITAEFAYLTRPIAYYSYSALKIFLQDYRAEAYSRITGTNKSWYNLIDESAPEDDLGGRHRDLFFASERETIEFFNQYQRLIVDTDLKIESDHFVVTETIIDLYRSLELGLVIFILLILLSAIFIFATVSFATYLKHEKELMRMHVYGARFTDLNFSLLVEKLLLSLIIVTMSLGLSLLLMGPLNALLTSLLGIESLIRVQPNSVFLIMGLAFLVLVFVSISSVVIPTINKQQERVSRRLREYL